MPRPSLDARLAVKPFAGLVVVELGHSVAAPSAGQILGELGDMGTGRVAHQSELYAMLDAILLGHNTAYWVERFEADGIPCSPIQNLAEMLAHPQTRALGLVQPVPESNIQFIGLPLRFDGQRSAPQVRPPRLGEHRNKALWREEEA